MAAAIAVAHFFGDDTEVLLLALALLGTGAFAASAATSATARSTPRSARAAPISSGSAAHLVSLAVLLCLCFAAFYVVTQAG